MSDSQLSVDHPVYPPADTGTGSGTSSGETPSAAPAEAALGQIQVGDQMYGEAEIRELLSGQMRQDDYTRKTQDVAEMRRAVDADREAFEAERSSAAPASGGDEWDGVDEINTDLGKVLRTMSADIASVKQSAEAQRTQAAREANEDRLLDAALATVSGNIGYDKLAILQFCQDKSLDLVGHPEHAQLAYEVLNGRGQGRADGERAAVARGADVPAPMGASPTGVSLGMGHPYAAPGPSIPIGDKSWADIATEAESDPEIR